MLALQRKGMRTAVRAIENNCNEDLSANAPFHDANIELCNQMNIFCLTRDLQLNNL